MSLLAWRAFSLARSKPYNLEEKYFLRILPPEEETGDNEASSSSFTPSLFLVNAATCGFRDS